jgi:hypothetical protein
MSATTTSIPIATTPEQRAALREKMRPLWRELQTYHREVPRLLAEGEVGRHAVVQGDQVHGTWDTYRDAMQYGAGKFDLDTPFMVHQVDRRDPELFAWFFEGTEGACPS